MIGLDNNRVIARQIAHVHPFESLGKDGLLVSTTADQAARDE
jgi:hypothetical protein